MEEKRFFKEEFKGKFKEERGVVVIVVAVALVALLLSVAVVTDIGILYQERRQLQTSTDAAALAAAMDIAEGRSADEARQKAIDYVSENTNVAASQIAVNFLEGNKVQVVAGTERGIFFGGLIGRKTSRVATRSTAAFGAAHGVAKLVPFIVPLQKISEYTGAENAGTFEIGEDRPIDVFSKEQSINGDIITYTITYNNTSNKPESATIYDYIPDGTVYVNGSATNGGLYDPSTKMVTWGFSNVSPGDYRIMRFSVKATSVYVGAVTNTAYLTTSSNNKTISASTGGNSAQKGYFWLCDFKGSGTGVPDYAEWIKNGFQDYVYAGDVANGVGVKDSLKDALSWRKNSNPKLLVPVYSYTEGGGSPGKYHVVGFAEFVITGFNFNGQPKTISGYFTDGTVAEGAPGPIPSGYFGIDTVWLVE
ncbi:MAG: DUF11 domain-containing protein [Firmicutes bacterium]|nr:DUF11 domain-containing protein [Bacillota bacterium]